MLFWLTCIVLTFAVTAIIVAPLLRPAQERGPNPDIAIYQAQLAEIDRDVARGLLEPQEAESARTEVARRLLAASRTQTDATVSHSRTRKVVRSVVGFCFVIPFVVYMGPAGIARDLGVSEERIEELKNQLVLPVHMILPARFTRNADVEMNLPLFFEGSGTPGYGDLPLKARLAASDEMRANRPSQAALEATAPLPPAVDVPADYRDAIEQLRVIAPTRPDDLEAWSRLAFHETELRNYAGAAAAQAHTIGIQGDAATPLDWQRLLDLQVVAAGGFVSPESETVIERILELEPNNIAAHYYLGVLFNQTDRPDLAFRIWRDLVEAGDPNNFHIASARAQISDAAFRAGIEYALPETRGPSVAEMDAASELSAEDQQAMIGNMVAGLADRLANEGGPARDWARLIRAYGVLGDLDAAGIVWAEAQQVFVSSMRDMEILTNAARDAGVLE